MDPSTSAALSLTEVEAMMNNEWRKRADEAVRSGVVHKSKAVNGFLAVGLVLWYLLVGFAKGLGLSLLVQTLLKRNRKF